MGCGSSTAAGAGTTLSKDPEDFHLEHLNFKKMKVPVFDEYLDEVEPAVNQVVDIVNAINGCIDEVKEAAAILCGGFKVDIDLGCADHDKIILALQKADGSHPTDEEAKKLLADPKVAKADVELAKARKALHAETEKAYVKFTLAGDVLSSEASGAAMQAFNKALAELRSAVGAAYKIAIVHKPAAMAGARSISVRLAKAVFPKSDVCSDDFSMEPVSVLDVLKSKEAKNIFAAEQSVADAFGGLTKAINAAETSGLQVSFELKKKKLVAKMEGEGENANAAKAALRKAVGTANGQLFKLQKAARNSNGVINVAKALIAVFEAFNTSAMALAKDATNVIQVNPKFNVSLESGFDFDLGLKVNLPDFEGMEPLDAVMKVLPGPAKIVLDAIIAIKDRVIEMIPEFTTLAEQIEQLIQKSEEVFAEPSEKIKAAFGEENEDPFAIPKAVAAAAGNLKIVTTEPVTIVKCMKDTVTRLNDEFVAAANEVKALFP